MCIYIHKYWFLNKYIYTCSCINICLYIYMCVIYMYIYVYIQMIYVYKWSIYIHLYLCIHDIGDMYDLNAIYDLKIYIWYMWDLYRYMIYAVHDKCGTYNTCEMLYTSDIFRYIYIYKYLLDTWYMLYI